RNETHCFVHSLLSNRAGALENIQLSNEGRAQERHIDKDPHDSKDQVHHSRLLTKRQITNLTLGIRELSKKLASLKLQLKVRNVFILGKAGDDTLIKLEREVTKWIFQRYGDIKVYVQDSLRENERFDARGLLEQNPQWGDRLRYWNQKLCEEEPQMFDIVLALGGDGTVLYASWIFQRVVPPVLSFSLGSLGFLTKFDFDQFPVTLSRAFDEGITVSLRLRFEATVMRSQNRESKGCNALIDELIGAEEENNLTHKPEPTTHNILNEVVVDRGPNPTMSTIELFGDDEHFTTIQADGVCIATPTGSTAYNLAAGGSLCHPDNPVVLVTAICAHTLSFRPIILPDTVVLRVGVPYDARTSSWASFDGRERVELKPGDYVTISVSRYPFSTVMPLDGTRKDWIESISRTLQWNSRQRQKPL
ncbi:ATP-NAD kinase, partial [Sporormia fimetaria CBS 119925]